MQLNRSIRVAAAAGLFLFSACSKNDSVKTSTPPLQVGQPVTDTYAGGPVTGTMLAGHTYTVTSDITVAAGDTLLLQSGVTINMGPGTDFIVKGTLISLGTQTAPNYITATGATRSDMPLAITAYASDPAFQGKWLGINCETTCALFIMKWTHVQYTGGQFVGTPVTGVTPATASFAIMFQNPSGVFDMEDSWVYGTVDDAVRITYGKVNIMRNTFEKCGSNTGECVNVKSGTVGDIAYNMFMGSATNGTKISDAGATPTQCNVNCYNNTFVDCGYRQASTSGHGGSINLEKNGQAQIFNNLVVNCKIGLRIVSTADTKDAKYGNTYFYGDDATVAGEFYSVGDATVPQTTDFPLPSSYLPQGYTPGASYDASAVIGKNNPMFKNFTLPLSNYAEYNYVTNYDFHLQAGSPGIGKGSASAVTPKALVSVDANYGATEITAPGSDEGCYQSNGKGNQH
jgi:hypothetical protein